MHCHFLCKCGVGKPKSRALPTSIKANLLPIEFMRSPRYCSIFSLLENSNNTCRKGVSFTKELSIIQLNSSCRTGNSPPDGKILRFQGCGAVLDSTSPSQNPSHILQLWRLFKPESSSKWAKPGRPGLGGGQSNSDKFAGSGFCPFMSVSP